MTETGRGGDHRRHELKTWPAFFDGLLDESKTAEVRKNDRDFRVGDLLVLREFVPLANEYTGRVVVRLVGRVDPLGMITGQADYVLLSFGHDPVTGARS